MTTSRRKTVALYGGSFNPITIAHVMAVHYVLATEPVDSVWVMPTFIHPDGKKMEDFVWRANMCRKSFLGESIGRVVVSEVERELGGISYSLRTVKHLVDKHGHDTDFRFVIGSDCVQNKATWASEWDTINELAPMVVLGRTGCEVEGVVSVLPPVSSTQVRNLIAKGDMETIKRLVPSMVIQYIKDKKLYGVG